MGRRHTLRLLAAALAISAGALLPASVAAHPLGNFTINHYAGLTIAPDHVDLEVIIDMAEIPTFQERQTMDADGDGSIDDAEAASWGVDACAGLVKHFVLEKDNTALSATAGPSAVSFPAGAGGLSTLRLECAYTIPLVQPVGGGPSRFDFADTSYLDRVGWREIVATGSGTILDTHGLPVTSPSQKLTSYPAGTGGLPLDIRSAMIDVRLDPAGAPAPPAPSATPAAGSAGGPVATPPTAAVPGGVAAELPAIFDTADLTPLVLLGALATAAFIGALHALTPGHGKTLMAAYLVGSRGTSIHAVGLGLSVAVSHTLGIFGLALIIVGAGSVLPPDVVYRVTPVIAGASIVAIGGWMLISEVRRRRHVAPAHDHDGDHGHEHEHPHPDAHEHPHAHAHPHPHDTHPGPSDTGEHSHGGVRHTHLPPTGATLSWRGLFVLGLAGGLIPSTSALLLLLGSINAGRPAFGLVLVVAFGLGMAAVMTAVGLAMIFARTRLDRMPSRSSLGRLAAVAPLVASVAVLGLGIVLTYQAVAGRPVL